MRVSEQEGLKAAESQSQGLAPAFTRFEGAVGRQRSPDSISGEGAPMNHVNQRGLSEPPRA